MATIKERIKALRKEKELTQEELSKMLGLNSKSNIANYENGTNAPSDEVKLKMCEIFNCTLDYLMGKSEFRTLQEYYESISKYAAEKELPKRIVTQLYSLGLQKQDVDELIQILSYRVLGEKSDEEKDCSADLIEEFLCRFQNDMQMKIIDIVSDFFQNIQYEITNEQIKVTDYKNNDIKEATRQIDDVLNEAMIGMSKAEYEQLTETQKKQIRDFALFVKNQSGDDEK